LGEGAMRHHERINPASTSITSLRLQAVIQDIDNLLGFKLPNEYIHTTATAACSFAFVS
jgi:hypothetical protein